VFASGTRSKGGNVDYEIRAVYFDLGGVYYTEGFMDGLHAIARKHGLDEEDFYRTAVDIIFANGYVRGEVPETEFWEHLVKAAGIEVNLFAEREVILAAFKPLPGMPELAARIREQTFVGLLTDQCNWLYELDDRDNLLSAFDTVVSSYEEGLTKRDMEIFRVACQRFSLLPEEIAFFDDNPDNIERAKEFGIRAFLFENAEKTDMILRAEGLEFPAASGGGSGV
jgi:HAD superfamily hydrolase (TIGR01509 family)